MDEQTLENIEQAAQKLAKAVEAPENQETTEEFIELFKGLGKEGTKEFAKGLDEVELAFLDDILSKAISFDKQAVKQPQKIKQPASESLDSTRDADKEDEEMVVSAAAAHNHQGDNTPEGFDGQIIKSEDFESEVKEIETLVKSLFGESEVSKVSAKKEEMTKADAANQMWYKVEELKRISDASYIIKSEVPEAKDVLEKKFSKLKSEIRGLASKYSSLKKSENGTKKEIQDVHNLILPEGMTIEQAQEIVTKSVEAGKAPQGKDLSKMMPEMDEESKKKAKKDKSKPMSGDASEGSKSEKDLKPKTEGATAQGEQISKAYGNGAAMPAEEKGKAKASSQDLPLASAGKKDSKKAKDQNPMSGNPKEGSKTSKDQKPSAEGAKAGFKKSVVWGSAQDARLLKAGGRGQNAHYNSSYEILKEEQRRQTIEKGQAEDGARWEPAKEVKLEKSEGEAQEDGTERQDVGINDIIEKGLDRSQNDLQREASNAAEPIAKSAPLSFEEREIAKSLGMAEDDTDAILGRPSTKE